MVLLELMEIILHSYIRSQLHFNFFSTLKDGCDIKSLSKNRQWAIAICAVWKLSKSSIYLNTLKKYKIIFLDFLLSFVAEPMSFTNFEPDQPTGGDYKIPRCLLMFANPFESSYQWKDTPCSAQFFTMCELGKNSSSC